MADKSKIQWLEGGATWNPIRGCSHAGVGCVNCYAEKQAARWAGPGGPYEGLVRDGKWTGDVRFILPHLDDPLRWQRPRRIFVNSMSDLFHAKVVDNQIDDIWARMLLAPQHTFLVLTKRIARAKAYLTNPDLYRRILRSADRVRAERPHLADIPISDPGRFPASWIHLLASCSVQEEVDNAVPLLLQTPAAVRGLSLEPLCEPVMFPRDCLDWVIVGGESGPGARPCRAEWIRGMVYQCRAMDVPLYVKQLGSLCLVDHKYLKPMPWPRGTLFSSTEPHTDIRVELDHPKGGNPAEWPAELNVREYPAPR